MSFKIKYNTYGLVVKFKTKLMAQGFLQIQGIDFSDIFALIIWKELLYIYLAICIALNYFIYQVDII